MVRKRGDRRWSEALDPTAWRALSPTLPRSMPHQAKSSNRDDLSGKELETLGS